MRRAQQQEILELVKTLHEAHAEIKGNIEKRKNHIAQSILADCQECAISIGNVIEAFEGEGFVTISYLEEYCQVLFMSHENLNEINVNENRIYKNLEKQLIKIENSIKNDIPIRKEIAFFPYKASMWDSLESIYLAAKADPEVDAYCVPIPYYDLKADRSFGQMHYEGLEYPKNIEVIDWQTYNFEQRKPDVIYIHNPYDNWNLVTSVHPRFYSDKLKVATEELVYVPYFVLQEIEPTNQHAIDGMKHFCYLPGIINADKVILQSENMAKIYINEYQKAAKANGLTGRYIDRDALEEKFLGLGSPKFDKVKNTKKEDLEIPEEWLKIIEKTDGSWKKIIFYNTSIAALLEHNEKMLEKMKWVFNVFKENKDEVALLWRPHPLIKNTVSAMRPWLWLEYEKLVQQYREEGWGIYDDTADMDRAVVLSNAYYGDASSVVQVYQKTGKPVMIQHPYAIEQGGMWDYLPFYEALVIGNKLWCFDIYEDELYTIGIETGEIDYIGELKGTGELSYGSIRQYQDRLIFVPWRSQEIEEYDIKTKEKRRYLYTELSAADGERASIVYGDYLYVFPYQDKYIYKLNLLTGESYKTNFPAEYNEDIALIKYCSLIDKKVMIPCENSNQILIYELDTEKIEIKKIDEVRTGFRFVAQYDGNIYLLDKENKLYRTSTNLNRKMENVLSLSGEYRDIRMCGDKLVLILKEGKCPKDICVVDLKKKSVQMLKDFPNIKEKEALPHVAFATCDKDKIYFIPGSSKEIILYDTKNNQVKCKKWNLNKNTQEHIEELARDKVHKGIILREGFVPLGLFVTIVTD